MKLKISMATQEQAELDFFEQLVHFTRGKSAGALFTDVNNKEYRGNIHVKDLDTTVLVSQDDHHGNAIEYHAELEEDQADRFAEETAITVKRVCDKLRIKFYPNPKDFFKKEYDVVGVTAYKAKNRLSILVTKGNNEYV